MEMAAQAGNNAYFDLFRFISIYFDLFWFILIYFDLFLIYFDLFWFILIYFDFQKVLMMMIAGPNGFEFCPIDCWYIK